MHGIDLESHMNFKGLKSHTCTLNYSWSNLKFPIIVNGLNPGVLVVC